MWWEKTAQLRKRRSTVSLLTQEIVSTKMQFYKFNKILSYLVHDIHLVYFFANHTEALFMKNEIKNYSYLRSIREYH